MAVRLPPFVEQVLLCSDALHIDEGITHPAQGGIDADIQFFGNFLETHILIKPHEYYLALRLRQLLIESYDIRKALFPNALCFYIAVTQVGAVQYSIVFIIAGDGVVTRLFAKIVHDDIVSNTGYPSLKFVGS